MELSKELIQEFASATNDTPPKETETTCYGTARFVNDVGYVTLDGAEQMTPAIFTCEAHDGDRVLVLLKARKALVIGNISSPVLTVGILKANVGIIVQGYLTTNANRTLYNDWVNTGMTISSGGIGGYGNQGKWYMTNSGKLYAEDAYIRGDIQATSLNLSSNISATLIDGLAAVATSGSYTDLSGKPNIPNVDYLSYYFDSNGILRLGTTSEGNRGFWVARDGLLQAYNAVIYGTIYASAGRIGGLEISSNAIKTLNADVTANGQNNIAFSSSSFTRTVAGASRSNLKLAIGSGFGVDRDGTLYATNAYIRGDVQATSLNLTTAAQTSLQNTIDGRISANAPDLTIYISKGGVIGTQPTSGATGFVVSTAGLLQASNAIIYGEIHASSGNIGGLKLSNGALYTDGHSAWNTNADGVFINDTYVSLGNNNKRSYIKSDGSFQFGGPNGITFAGSKVVMGSSVEITFDTPSNVLTTSNWSNTITTTSINNMGVTAISLNANTTNSGTIHAGTNSGSGYPFNVASNGDMTATSANITGTVNARSGEFGPANANYKITIGSSTASGVRHSAIYYAMTSLSSTTATGFYIGTDGFALGGGKFKVTSGGALTATDATITGSFKSGTPVNNEYPFQVTTAGVMTAKGATVKGRIDAYSGTFGAENATNKINIGTNTTHASIYYAMTSLSSTTSSGFYIGTDGIALGGGKFKVTSAGKLTASDADITGTIKAKSLTVNDYISVSSTAESGSILYNTTFILRYTTGSWNSYVDDYYPDNIPPGGTYRLMTTNAGLSIGGNLDVGTNKLIGRTVECSGLSTHTLCVDQGERINSFSGVSAVEGYILMCRLHITKTYIDHPIEIRYLVRNAKAIETITIRFTGVSTTDPAVALFTYFCNGQDTAANAWIDKESAGNWDIYIKKNSSYGVVTPISVAKAVSSPDIYWIGDQVNTLPDTATQATKVG